MANKKISELPYINGSKISGNTLVPLVTYFSASTGDTVHTYIDDFQTYLISGLTGNTDVFVTGGTYSAGTITFTNNTGGTFNVTGLTTGSTSTISGEYLPLSGGTVTGGTQFTAGLSANTISATTYLNLPITTDVFVTGGTYSAGISTFTNNTGGTFNVTGFYTGETSYVNSLTTGVGLSADTTTGDITIVNTDPDQVVVLNNGTNINVTGTYPNFTIDVTGLTDFNTFTTGFTYSSNTFTISDNSGNTFDATFTEVTGLTVNGDLNITGATYSNVISATTYQNLPITTDVFVTGGTYSAGTSTFTNNTGGTFSVSGFVTGDTYVTGLTFNTGNYNLTIGRNDGVSFTDSLAILASDLTVTGGTYDPNTGSATFTNNTGGTFTVTGFLTGFTDTYVTGGTYSNGTATFTNTSGGTFNVSGFYTGDTTTITGATSVGTGVTIFDSVIDRGIKINSITGDTLEKITTSLSSNTIQVGINEQNLTLWDLVVQGNRLLSGNVSYISGLTFSVSPLEYLINGTIYDITSATTVTLNSGDTTYDRIDVIYADISGNTGILEGTPSENPEKPIVDGDTQVEVTFVLVPANSTTADITSFLIYNENAGPPTEWAFGSGGLQPTRISGDSTDTAYSGVTSIKVSGVTGAYTTFFRLTGSTILDTNEYATLQFAIKNLSANTTSSRIRLRFLSTGGTQNGNAVFMNAAGSSGYVQYSSTNTSTWQLVSIPLWRFYLTNTNVQVLEVAFYPIGAGAQSRYYFDLLEFVEGTASSPPSNSWTTIKGDSATTITAPNPNATLTISGGTNIGSFISGTSTVVLNLDNNITLGSVSATTISATTYQNLPVNVDVFVTGGTYSAGTVTFTNNTGGTFNVTGLTTGSTSTISGDYLPLSGGTVTGQTFFTSGLTITGDTIIIDSTGTSTAIDTSTRELVDSSGLVSVDWRTRLLYNGAGNATINYDGAILYDSTSIPSVDWFSRQTYDDLGVLSIDWQYGRRRLYDVSSNESLDWDIRKLTKSDGTTVSFDWENGILTGQTNIESSTIYATTYQNLPISGLTEGNYINISGSNGNYTISVTGLTQGLSGDYLPLSGGTVTGGTSFESGLTANTIYITGNSFNSDTDFLVFRIQGVSVIQSGVGSGVEIQDSIGNTVFDSENKKLLDLSSATSVDWENRLLYKSGGTISFDWENGILTGQTNIQSSTISATTYQNLPDNVTGKYLPLSGGTVTGNTIFTSGLTANTLNVTGNTNVRTFTGTTGYISGSGQNILTVIGSGNSTTSPIFSVQGSSGELFSVSDSLVGSLFSVNDISGLPIVEVFSDNTTLWGSYQAPSLNTTTKTSLSAGTNTIYSIPTSAYTGAFYEYTLISTGTTGARAGQIMSIWSGTSANFTETSTLDIGTTTGVTFTVAVSGSNAVLSSSATTAGWTVKTIIRSI